MMTVNQSIKPESLSLRRQSALELLLSDKYQPTYQISREHYYDSLQHIDRFDTAITLASAVECELIPKYSKSNVTF